MLWRPRNRGIASRKQIAWHFSSPRPSLCIARRGWLDLYRSTVSDPTASMEMVESDALLDSCRSSLVVRFDVRDPAPLDYFGVIDSKMDSGTTPAHRELPVLRIRPARQFRFVPGMWKVDDQLRCGLIVPTRPVPGRPGPKTPSTQEFPSSSIWRFTSPDM